MLVERIVEGSKIDVPITYAISGNEITYSTNPEVRGVFKLDPTTRPKTFDLDVVSKDGKVGDKWMGIYAIEGDTLKICTSLCFLPSGKPATRPKAFESKEGSGHKLDVFKRVKGEK